MTDKTITLASIREDIEERYGHTPIDIGTGNPVLLINPTRLSEAQRQGLRQYQDRMQALAADGEKEDEVASEEDLGEQVALMRGLLETVAESPAGATRLLKAIDGLPEGDRILAIAAVVERYMGQQGGSLALGELIDEHGAALTADLRFYYGVVLRDALFGKRRRQLSPRELLAYIARLPEGSRFRAELRDPDDWREYLDVGVEYYPLAGIYNAVNANTSATGHFKRRPKLDPWPIPAIAADRAKKQRAKGRATVASLYGALFSNRAALPRGIKE